MESISPSYFELLKAKLESEFVPELPVLLDLNKSKPDIDRKNLSRAFSAFVLQQLCGISASVAANAVVDDFNDKGIDAIYFDSIRETLYLVQTKLEKSNQFKEAEALAFCQGIRKIIQQDLASFNLHFQRRQEEIERAVETCEHIQLVIAHVGGGISAHARIVIQELINDSTHQEERFCDQFIDYDAQRVVEGLQQTEAPAPVKATLLIEKHQTIESPRKTYVGLIALSDLVTLYSTHGVGLYEKNIRTFLGKNTNVNAAIQRTLAENPANFFYLNNGVTALAQKIKAKGLVLGRKRIDVNGLSIVNGAQTITAAAQFLTDNSEANIADARVAFTLIEVAEGEDFGKAITQARNHQNQVSLADFAALDNEQERLRRDMALLGVHYVYKSGTDASSNANTIRIDEAAYGLALFQPDPRFVVWLKREPGSFLVVGSEPYRSLFSSAPTAQQLINAVRFRRYVRQRIDAESQAAPVQEKLAYRHGEYALGWLLAQQIRQQQSGHQLLSADKISTVLSEPFDKLRQLLWDETQLMTEPDQKGSLALFRNQTDVMRLLERVSVKAYDLTNQAALTAKKQQQNPDQPYPVDLFAYILDKAPQIPNLI